MTNRTCEACGAAIERDPQWSRDYYSTRRFCDRSCQEKRRPSIMADYVVTAGGCWEWQGHIDENGYGTAYDPQLPSGNRVDWAHRVSYRHHVGLIPEGLELDHTCVNPPCINPEHLEPVTKAENIRRSFERRGYFDRQAHAARLRVNGLTYQEIADALGIIHRSGAASVVQTAIDNGLVDAGEVPPPRRTLTPSEREDIRDMYALGVPQKDIGTWYRLDNSQVSRIVNGRSSGHRTEPPREAA